MIQNTTGDNKSPGVQKALARFHPDFSLLSMHMSTAQKAVSAAVLP